MIIPEFNFKVGQMFSLVTRIGEERYNVPEIRQYNLVSKLRRVNNNSEDGFIGNLSATWANVTDCGSRYDMVQLTSFNTDNWPVCTAELDIELYDTSGNKFNSESIIFDITRGIS